MITEEDINRTHNLVAKSDNRNRPDKIKLTRQNRITNYKENIKTICNIDGKSLPKDSNGNEIKIYFKYN